MAALNFPSSPALNDTYTANGKTWTWNGTSWVYTQSGVTVTDGDKGDITVASSGTSWTIDSGVVGTSKLGGDITTAGKALLDDADAAAQRTTLGLGAAALLADPIPVANGGTGQTTYTNGQLLIGNTTGNTLTKATLTQGTGITITNGTGTISIANASPDQTVAFTNGTGISVTGTYPNFTVTNSAPDQTVAFTNGTGISVTGTYPNFTVTNSAPDQTVALTNGTGISVTGTYPNFTITNSSPDQTVAFTNGTNIAVTGTYPNFTVGISGIVGAANGGTGNGFTAFSGPTTSTKTFTLPDASSTILTSNAAVTVAQGGTGVQSTTAYAVQCGGTTSTSAHQAVSGVGTSGQVLTSNGSGNLPTWQNAAASGVSSITFGSTGLTPSTATTGAVTVAGTLALANGGTGATSAPAAFSNFTGYTTTATAAGTTTLTNASSYLQLFTGTSTQTIVMPVTSTLALGWEYRIINNSTGNLTVNSSGANLIATVLPNTGIILTCILTSGTTAASWDFSFTDFGSNTGTGANVLATSPTLTTPTISSIVNTGTLTLPTSTDTLVGRATTDTLTNKRINPRVSSTTSITSPLALNSDNFDQYAATAQSTAFTISADAGTPVDGQKMTLRFLDNGTTRTITFTGGVSKGYRPVGVTLTASGNNWTYATTASKTVYFGMVYNAAASRWDIIALAQE